MFSIIRKHKLLIAAVTFGFPIAYYLIVLAAMIVHFDQFPNYLRVYDWGRDIVRIIHTTPSVRDMIPIIFSDWVAETGVLNSQYGPAITVWSLSIMPEKVILVMMAGFLVGVNGAVFMERRRFCAPRIRPLRAAAVGGGLTASLGTALATVTSVTVFSVSCCSTISWIGGLTILGMAESTALAIEPFGAALSGAGFAILGILTALQARRVTSNRTERNTHV
jgi:hypothetical protein